MSYWLFRDLSHEFINALPAMAAAGLIYWFVRRHLHKKRFGGDFKEVRRKSRLNEIIGLLLVIWAALVFSSTVISLSGLRYFWRDFSFIPRWRLIPDFITYGRHIDISHSLVNVIMFMPIGLALPFVLKRPTFGHTVLVGFCFTFYIEYLQGFSGQRDGNIDDVICNTLGAIVGFLLYLLMKLIFPKFTAKCMLKAKKSM
ncbi:MAG: VanZ family protein [Oscillospiraceae bacterium]|nr:VanZ family protein [Oscillospiraceae bacterium]